MKSILACGRIGALYGVLASWVLCFLLLLLMSGHTLLHWPADGTLRWFLEGELAFLILFIVLGFIFGGVSGFVFGIVGSVINHRLGWPLAGILSGAVFYQMYRWFLLTLSRAGSWPADMHMLLLEVALPMFWFGTLGLVVERALRRGRPRLPQLELLSRALAQWQRP